MARSQSIPGSKRSSKRKKRYKRASPTAEKVYSSKGKALHRRATGK